jgi:hypothetical protein
VKNRLEVVVDVAMIATAAVAGVIVGGKALEMVEPRVRSIPVVGPIVRGVKAAWWTVYNP